LSAGLRTPDFGVIWLMIGAIIDAVRDVSGAVAALPGDRNAGPQLTAGDPAGPLGVLAVSPQQMEQLLVGAWRHRS